MNTYFIMLLIINYGLSTVIAAAMLVDAHWDYMDTRCGPECNEDHCVYRIAQAKARRGLLVLVLGVIPFIIYYVMKFVITIIRLALPDKLIVIPKAIAFFKRKKFT